MMVEVMFSLGFFFPRRQLLACMRYCVAAMYCMCILRARNIHGVCEREQRILQRICCRLCLFILLDNIKEGLDVLGGHSLNWVNHVYLCLSSFMFFVCLCFLHILCVSLICNI